jgi:surface antigen
MKPCHRPGRPRSTLLPGLGLSALLAACAAEPNRDLSAAIYQAMTADDVSLAAKLLQRTLDHAPDGATRRWINDQSGHQGAITPVRTYIDQQGQFCRDYREELQLGEERGEFFYSACRDEDDWEL